MCRLAAAIKQVNTKVNNIAEAKANPKKFDPYTKIGLSRDAPPPSEAYDVIYDPKIGNEYIPSPWTTGFHMQTTCLK